MGNIKENIMNLDLDEVKEMSEKEIFEMLYEDLRNNANFNFALKVGKYHNLSPFKSVMLYCRACTEDNVDLTNILQSYIEKHGTDVLMNHKNKED